MYYQITLKPLESFYFGAEDSFGSPKSEDKRENYFSKGSAYFAKGEIFPQQTQILGMLRKEILKHKQHLKYYKNDMWVSQKDRGVATALVGSRWTIKQTLDLGEIEQLSPLFLLKDKSLYVPSAVDKDLILDKIEGKSIINGRENKTEAYRFIKKDKKPFGAKDYLCSSYISDNGEIELDDIFTKRVRTENQTLGYIKDDDEEQLYKMQSYSLDKEFSFVFYLTSKSDFFGSEYRSTVEIGGERSRFVFVATKIDKLPEISTFYELKEENCIVLLSDSLVDSSIFSYCKISLSDKISFRTILNRKSFSKSSRVMLLKKGTVFYPKDENARKKILACIRLKRNFRRIGYNQYIDLKN